MTREMDITTTVCLFVLAWLPRAFSFTVLLLKPHELDLRVQIQTFLFDTWISLLKSNKDKSLPINKNTVH